MFWKRKYFRCCVHCLARFRSLRSTTSVLLESHFFLFPTLPSSHALQREELVRSIQEFCENTAKKLAEAAAKAKAQRKIKKGSKEVEEEDVEDDDADVFNMTSSRLQALRAQEEEEERERAEEARKRAEEARIEAQRLVRLQQAAAAAAAAAAARAAAAQAGGGCGGGASFTGNILGTSSVSAFAATPAMRTGAGAPAKKQARVASDMSSSAASALSGVSQLLRGVVGVAPQGLFRGLEGGGGPVAMPGGGLPRAQAAVENRMEEDEEEKEEGEETESEQEEEKEDAAGGTGAQAADYDSDCIIVD